MKGFSKCVAYTCLPSAIIIFVKSMRTLRSTTSPARSFATCKRALASSYQVM